MRRLARGDGAPDGPGGEREEAGEGVEVEEIEKTAPADLASIGDAQEHHVCC